MQPLPFKIRGGSLVMYGTSEKNYFGRYNITSLGDRYINSLWVEMTIPKHFLCINELSVQY